VRPPLRSLLVPALAALASCINVTPPAVAFSSEPPGARVLVDGRDSGWVTPCLIALEDEEHMVTLTLDGHVPVVVALAPWERKHLVDWRLGVNGVRSTIRFPLLLPGIDLLLPLRVLDMPAPGRVFVRLHPNPAPPPAP
jgi:hypothetical protein